MTITKRIALAALFAAVSGAMAPPAQAGCMDQSPCSSAEPEQGRVYQRMNLNPPGVTGKVYNDGTIEAP